jgi:DHR-2, Lobe C
MSLFFGHHLSTTLAPPPTHARNNDTPTTPTTTEVNAGPLEFCRVFLGAENVHKYQAAEVKALKHAMGEFVKTCVKALAVNKSIIDADQIGFHDQLVKGYVHMKTEVLKYIGVGAQSHSASDLLKKAGSSTKLEGMRQIAQTATKYAFRARSVWFCCVCVFCVLLCVRECVSFE